MPRKKKQSPLITEYRRQRRRIQNTVSRYRRQGYDVQFEIPAIPKTITKSSIARLSKITPEKIQSKTYGVNYETGEQVPLPSVRAYQRKNRPPRASKPQAPPQPVQSAPTPPPVTNLPDVSDVIIANFRTHVSYYPEAAREIALDWLRLNIDNFGRQAVAEMLQQGQENGEWLEPKEVYSSEALYAALANMLTYLDVSPAQRNDILAEIDSEYQWDDF